MPRKNRNFFLLLSIHEKNSRTSSRVVEEIEIGDGFSTEEEAQEAFEEIVEQLETEVE